MTSSTSFAQLSLVKFGPLLLIGRSPPASGLPLPPTPQTPPLTLTSPTSSVLTETKWTHLLHFFYSAQPWLVCLQKTNHVFAHLVCVFSQLADGWGDLKPARKWHGDRHVCVCIVLQKVWLTLCLWSWISGPNVLLLWSQKLSKTFDFSVFKQSSFLHSWSRHFWEVTWSSACFPNVA